MKLLYDFFPIILFFVAYKVYGIYVATTVAIIISFIQVIVHWLRFKNIDKMQLSTLLIILIMGGATLILHNELFIKWKPTVINWVFGLAFLGSHVIGDNVLVKRMLSSQVQLPDRIWRRLNLSWVIFFFLSGLLNVIVIYTLSTNAWVNFKLFGLLGLTILFIIGQSFYLVRHLDEKQLHAMKKGGNDHESH